MSRIEKLEAFVKEMWSCSCVRSEYDQAVNKKTMWVNSDAAKYGEVLIQLKELVEGR